MVKRNEGGFIWIPRPYKPSWKILINTTEVTDDLLPGGMEFNLPATTHTGKFTLKLDNSNGTYNNFPVGAEDVYIYFDHDKTTPTTLQFRGIVENYKHEGPNRNVISIEGIHVAGQLVDLTVTKEYTTATACSTILKEIIDEFAPDFTYTNVETTTTTFDPNWEDKPFWECVVDLCVASGNDCYVDNTLDFHYFESNTKTTELDAIVWSDNLLDRGGLGDRGADVKNVVKVYGEDENGLPVMAEARDSTASNFGDKELIIKDTSIKTYDEAKTRADAELELQKTPQLKGEPSSLILTYMDGAGTAGHGGPGYKIWVSDPSIELQSTYKVTELKHRFDNNYLMTTTCSLEFPTSLPSYFRERASKEVSNETIQNPLLMKHSYNLPFDSNDETQSDSDTTIADGVLRLADTGSGTREVDGTSITQHRIADEDITSCEVRVSGQDYGGSAFYVSNDDGITWEQVANLGGLHTFAGTGKKLVVKINLLSSTTYPTPEIDSLVCLYK